MSHTDEMSKRPEESFPAYLRRKADDYERVAPAYEGCASYPPAWWLAAAAEDRKLADRIDAIHGGVA